RDEIERFDPKKPKPKKVSVVLVDVSDSMKAENKFVLRNSLMNAYLDKSQRDVLIEGGQHAVYFIKFDSKAHNPVRLGSPEDAQNFFNNMRSNPISNGGSTSVTAA